MFFFRVSFWMRKMSSPSSCPNVDHQCPRCRWSPQRFKNRWHEEMKSWSGSYRDPEIVTWVFTHHPYITEYYDNALCIQQMTKVFSHCSCSCNQLPSLNQGFFWDPRNAVASAASHLNMARLCKCGLHHHWPPQEWMIGYDIIWLE